MKMGKKRSENAIENNWVGKSWFPCDDLRVKYIFFPSETMIIPVPGIISNLATNLRILSFLNFWVFKQERENDT